MSVKTEQIIVSLTTWSARINNIPVVLDTIFAQSLLPDKIVLNLAYNEVIPANVQTYINNHDIDIYRTEDTKVYKKFLPTLKRFKDACIINIDDDLLYPNTMIEDFWETHLRYPNHPICGNHMFLFGRMCHCGEASLTKYEYFGDYLNYIDWDIMRNCTSSDLVFTYFATKSGHPYVPSKGYYGNGVTESYNPTNGWSDNVNSYGKLSQSFKYLEQRFGTLPELFSTYVKDCNLLDIIVQLNELLVLESNEKIYSETEKRIRNSKAYRLGRLLLTPFSWIRT